MRFNASVTMHLQLCNDDYDIDTLQQPLSEEVPSVEDTFRMALTKCYPV